MWFGAVGRRGQSRAQGLSRVRELAHRTGGWNNTYGGIGICFRGTSFLGGVVHGRKTHRKFGPVREEIIGTERGRQRARLNKRERGHPETYGRQGQFGLGGREDDDPAEES